MTDIIGIGLHHFSLRADALKYDRARRRGLAEDAWDSKSDLHMAMTNLERALELMLRSRASKPAVAEALAILIDAVSDADHACNRDIDAAGEHFDEIDLTEARAMLDGLRP